MSYLTPPPHKRDQTCKRPSRDTYDPAVALLAHKMKQTSKRLRRDHPDRMKEPDTDMSGEEWK